MLGVSFALVNIRFLVVFSDVIGRELFEVRVIDEIFK